MQPTLAPAPQQYRPPPQNTLPAYHSHRPDQHPIPRNPHQHNIDPAISGSGIMNQHMGSEGSGEGEGSDKRGKRELSTSKRAAQNRAAQRAFRQRKEGHIKALETQVREFNALNETFKAVQGENHALREYALSLQQDLVRRGASFPPPPPHVDLQAHRHQANNQYHTQSAQTMASPNNGPAEDPSQGNGSAPTAAMRTFEDEMQAHASAAQAVAAEHKHFNKDSMTANQQRPRTADSSPRLPPPPNGLPGPHP
ncbi:MAG: hypothetical protein OHK93_004123 [Ramalina farinacea]|uniref:Putative transcription factor kapC n=1 Tax=Ramalina farinacea TaxID=258253 RepID=A0AA43QHW2_9LECA|nr:hypothetical protein [Ramalina farinacea]